MLIRIKNAYKVVIMFEVSFTMILVVAVVIRVGLIVYGEWQDTVMVVKYTDIDYSVFTDAAKYVAEGESPYERPTYRYTPLLAWLLLPNILVHRIFGKILFCTFDLIAGALIDSILQKSYANDKVRKVAGCLWLFNPLTLVVSSRGNAEAIMSVLVLATIHQFLERNFKMCAILWAVSVHFKIYPITYAIPMYLALERTSGSTDKKREKQKTTLRDFLESLLPNKQRLSFFLISLIVIAILTGAMYYCYGWVFLHETYIYHLTRSDTRHNFSPFFYLLYLSSEWEYGKYLGLVAFIPQATLLVAIAIKYYHYLPSCCFLQTFVFVTFNKVCTSQYFLWYLTLLPLVLPSIEVHLVHGATMVTLWFSGQAVWLYYAYLLEFRGQNTFVQVWLASLLFFGINCWILKSFIQCHSPSLPKKLKGH